METANSPIFQKFENAKDHQTLLNFAILAEKWQKNAPYHIKSPVKNFHGRAKGGHRTVPPPKYATGYPVHVVRNDASLRSRLRIPVPSHGVLM